MIILDDRHDGAVNFHSQCALCRHLDAFNPLVCKAFPEGIPFKISKNKFVHDKPYPGDNGIRFEPIE